MNHPIFNDFFDLAPNELVERLNDILAVDQFGDGFSTEISSAFFDGHGNVMCHVFVRADDISAGVSGTIKFGSKKFWDENEKLDYSNPEHAKVYDDFCNDFNAYFGSPCFGLISGSCFDPIPDGYHEDLKKWYSGKTMNIVSAIPNVGRIFVMTDGDEYLTTIAFSWDWKQRWILN